jgi:hypothetical protein
MLGFLANLFKPSMGQGGMPWADMLRSGLGGRMGAGFQQGKDIQAGTTNFGSGRMGMMAGIMRDFLKRKQLEGQDIKSNAQSPVTSPITRPTFGITPPEVLTGQSSPVTQGPMRGIIRNPFGRTPGAW